MKEEEDLKSLGRMESASNTCGIFRHTGNEVVVGSRLRVSLQGGWGAMQPEFSKRCEWTVPVRMRMRLNLTLTAGSYVVLVIEIELCIRRGHCEVPIVV